MLEDRGDAFELVSSGSVIGWFDANSAAKEANRLLVERQTQTPFELPLEPSDDAYNLRSLALHMMDRALVGREQREQLHRQHRTRREKSFDDGFMRHRPAADPVEIL